MFDPSSLVMLACPVEMAVASILLSAAGTAVAHQGQKQQAKNQKAYQEHLASMQLKAGQRKQSALIAKNIQESEATARKDFAVSQEAQKAAAMGRLSAAEGGVTGLSINHLVNEFAQQEAQYKFALGQEQKLRNRELDRQLKDVTLGTSQQMASTMAPVQEPNAFAAALEWGAGAASTASKTLKFKDGKLTSTS